MTRALLLLVTVGMLGCGEVGSSSTADDPTIAAISPDHGPTTGGATITLTGTNFQHGDAYVLVGGALATDVAITSDTELTFELPPGIENAKVDVVVGNDRGFATSLAAFQYNPRPVIIGVEPARGRLTGGTPITITGRGFQKLEAGQTTIRIGGGVATNVQVVDDTTLTATTGPIPPGPKPFTKVDVVLENANGSATLAETFTATARGLLVIERFSQRVHFVDRITGEATPLAPPAHRIGACATKDGIVYAVGPDGSGLPELVTLDPITGEFAAIGRVQAGNQMFGVAALAFAGDKLLGLDTNNRSSARTNRLVSIDLATGAGTLLGAAALAVGHPSALAARDANTIYYADNTGTTLDVVNANTGNLNPGPAFSGGNSSRVHSLANLDGTLYLAEQQTSRVFIVNPATGSLSLLVNLPFQPSGMCETPSTF